MAKQRLRFAGPSEGARLLLQAMTDRGLNKTSLAGRCGVSDSTVGRWLSGSRRPDATSLATIEGVVGIPARLWAVPPMVDRAA